MHNTAYEMRISDWSSDVCSSDLAAEMKCDALLKGTSVDGVYNADPKKDPAAKRYDRLTYDRVLADNLKVMDASAVALCRDNQIPLVVYNIRDPGHLARVLAGEGVSPGVAPAPLLWKHICAI